MKKVVFVLMTFYVTSFSAISTPKNSLEVEKVNPEAFITAIDHGGTTPPIVVRPKPPK